MSNLDNIIADINEVNKTYGFYIRNEDGTMRDDIICGEVIPFLEELKDYEIDLTQEQIIALRRNWLSMNVMHCDNTYNNNGSVDHDFEFDIAETNDGVYVTIMVHRFGDVRANYTDWAICKFDSFEEMFCLESAMQYKNINDRYMLDVNIFTEGYNVWDSESEEDLGIFYEIEVKDLLDEIKSRN